MPVPRRRGLRRPQRRPPVVPFGTLGFLRPPRHHEEEQRRVMERVREVPHLRREYRNSLVLQIVVVATLLIACGVLIVQSIVMLRQFRSPAASSLGWVLPAFVGFLALLVLRRLARLVTDLRRLRR